MSAGRDRFFGFGTGLQTTRLRDVPTAPFFRTFQNVRVNRGSAQRRKGYYAHASLLTGQVCTDFDGTNDVLKGYQSWALDRQFTIEWLWQVDSLSSARTILGGSSGAAAGLLIQHTSTAGGTVSFRFNSTTTVSVTGIGVTGAPCFGQIVRDGASLTLRVHGATSAVQVGTATHAFPTDPVVRQGAAGASDAVNIGAHDGADFMDGKIDFVRAFRYAKRGITEDAYTRLFNPRAPGVVFDYVTGQDAAGHCRDRGLHGRHLLPTGSPASATSIALNPNPVQMIAGSKKSDGQRLVYVMHGGRISPVYLS